MINVFIQGSENLADFEDRMVVSVDKMQKQVRFRLIDCSIGILVHFVRIYIHDGACYIAQRFTEVVYIVKNLTTIKSVK